MTRCTRIALLAAAVLASGCANRYVTPAGGVPMAELADEDLQSFYAREPASPFPANLAVVRVQDGGYVTRTSQGYGQGRYSVVTTRDVESDEFDPSSGRDGSYVTLPCASQDGPEGSA